MKFKEFQTSMSNSYGVFEVRWYNNRSVLHYGSWGITEVCDTPNRDIQLEKETCFEELPELVQDYIKTYSKYPDVK